MRKKTKRISKTGITPKYIHGFTPTEQRRLYERASLFEQSLFSDIDFSSCKRILEVGSGVGAQTDKLLKRYPTASITAIDSSPTQVAQAKKFLRKNHPKSHVKVICADALHLPIPPDSHDGAFLCWILEHVKNPLEILKEARRALSNGAVIHCVEVLNSSLFLHPYSPATMQYLFAFNDAQWTYGGDPFIGPKLGNLLQQAGYQEITLTPKFWFYDNRMPKLRATFFETWSHLLVSGSDKLLAEKKVDQALVKEMKREINALKDHPDSVFMYPEKNFVVQLKLDK